MSPDGVAYPDQHNIPSNQCDFLRYGKYRLSGPHGLKPQTNPREYKGNPRMIPQLFSPLRLGFR